MEMSEMTLEQAIELLKKDYERAENMERDKKPLAWALRQVLKKADAKKGGERHDTSIETRAPAPIRKCTCGGSPSYKEVETRGMCGMLDYSAVIVCKKCGRKVVAYTKDEAIKKWDKLNEKEGEGQDE